MDRIRVHNPAAITASASLPQPGSTPLTSSVAPPSSAACVRRSTHSGGAERGSYSEYSDGVTTWDPARRQRSMSLIASSGRVSPDAM
jgi:hypothetical protein